MSKAFIPFAAAALWLLPSCVFYPNIGQRIREPGEICTGLALPAAGGKVYKARFHNEYIDGSSSWSTFYYTEVTEVEFTRRSKLFHCDALLSSYPHPDICGIRPTGRKRLARVCLDDEDIHPTYVAEAVDALPAHATFSHTLPPPTADAPLELDNRCDFPHTKAGWGRRIAAAPFDYVIDPALKAVFYTGEAVCVLAAMPFVVVGEALCEAQQQQKAEEPRKQRQPLLLPPAQE